jgi:hypothetical protein
MFMFRSRKNRSLNYCDCSKMVEALRHARGQKDDQLEVSEAALKWTFIEKTGAVVYRTGSSDGHGKIIPFSGPLKAEIQVVVVGD